MKSKISITTRRLLNLYRQHNAIYGDWATINPIFLNEADDTVLSELRLLPTGSKLVKHIENLRSGKTPMDSIDSKLLPYGKLMGGSIESISLSNDEINEIKIALNEFTPDEIGLEKFKQLSSVKKFGDEWIVRLHSVLSNDNDALAKLDIVNKTARAYYLWKLAKDFLNSPLSDRLRARIQAELSEYETYLPLFGDAGYEVLGKLRNLVSSN